jgi:hypothetical protein
MSKSENATARAGWDIPSWCDACGFSRAKYYTLPAEMRPRALKLGTRHIVIEPPAQYLSRLADAQETA